MKKSLFFGISAVLLISFMIFNASAMNIKVEKKIVSDVVVSELDEPAVFNFSITNLGSSDNFQIYSLSGVDFIPRGTFNILGGETREIEARAYLDDSLKRWGGLVSFVYKIKGQGDEIFSDTITVNVVHFKDAIMVGSDNISPGDESASLIVENKFNFNFPEIKAKFSSAFFKDFEKSFSLSSLEKKKIDVALDSFKMKGLTAGQYLLSAEMESGKVKEELTGVIKFVERSGISVNEKNSGIFFRKNFIEKKNEGNIITLAEANIRKGIISRLFTKFEPEPTGVYRKGLSVYYSWSKELKPGDSLIVTAETNYLYPFMLLAVIVIIAYLIFIYTSSHLSLKKRVSFVKAKGGEFALKVSISVSARKFVEKISIVDRFPGMAKLYERFGAYPPNKIDEHNKRLEWDIENLQPGEERVFSYIIYSKVGVVGRFELPPALAVYEKDGKVREASSNRSFFMNEPRKSDEED